jgi:hypothetical protein
MRAPTLDSKATSESARFFNRRLLLQRKRFPRPISIIAGLSNCDRAGQANRSPLSQLKRSVQYGFWSAYRQCDYCYSRSKSHSVANTKLSELGFCSLILLELDEE